MKYSKLLLSLIILALLALPSLSFAASSSTPGVDNDVKGVMQLKSRTRVAYDVATTNSLLPEVSSVVAMTCFAANAASTLKFSGDLFSGDVTDGAKDTTVNDIENHFSELFSADKMISYDTKVEAKASLNVSITASVGADSGPTFKKIDKCENMGKGFSAQAKSAPIAIPNFFESIQKLATGGSSSTADQSDPAQKRFSSVWYDQGDNIKTDMQNADSAKASLKTKVAHKDYKGTEDPCGVMSKIGITVDLCGN